jgi:ATP-dependent DNA helicase HFM1/MER3
MGQSYKKLASTLSLEFAEFYVDLVSRGEHHRILSQIQLFLVDEVCLLIEFESISLMMSLKVHILNDVRGSTLEVVISRMKLRGTAVRFALVSATAPNIDDIASWIGSVNSAGSATIYRVRKVMICLCYV